MGHLQLPAPASRSTPPRPPAAAPRCRSFLTGAKATSTAHEKATGFPNDALVAYIQASQHEAGCPSASG